MLYFKGHSIAKINEKHFSVDFKTFKTVYEAKGYVLRKIAR